MPARRREQCVDFIDEDDARSVLSSLCKELSDTLGADADIHLVEAGPSAVQEGYASFASDGSRQHRLADAGISEQEDSFVHLCSLLGVSLRVSDHSDQVFDFLLDLVDAFDVCQPLCDLRALLEFEVFLLQAARVEGFRLLGNLLHKVVHDGRVDTSEKQVCESLDGQLVVVLLAEVAEVRGILGVAFVMTDAEWTAQFDVVLGKLVLTLHHL